MRSLALIPLLFLLAACGGGNTPDNAMADKPFIPDFSTPEGATAAYTYAIETMNLELVGLVAVPAERDSLVAAYRENFAVSKKENLRWRLEFDEAKSMYINETAVATMVKFIQIKGQSESVLEESWVVFVQTEDGSWKYSGEESRRWTLHLQSQNQPKEEPKEETPQEKPGDDPAAD